MAMSICMCGHKGGGEGSLHKGHTGHGACTVPMCPCTQFTWARFVDTDEEVRRKFPFQIVDEDHNPDPDD